jgi:hypothetical protein
MPKCEEPVKFLGQASPGICRARSERSAFETPALRTAGMVGFNQHELERPTETRRPENVERVPVAPQADRFHKNFANNTAVILVT